MKRLKYLVPLLFLAPLGAAALTTYLVPQGGTGATSFPANSILVSGTTPTGALRATSTNPLYVGSLFATTTTKSTLTGGFEARASSTLQAFTGTNATTTNSTSTTLSVSGNTNLFTLFTSSLSTLANLLTTGSTTLQNFTGVNSTTTQATTTTLNVSGNARFSTLLSSGLATFANLLSNGSSTLQNFTGVNATTTNATSTNQNVSGTLKLSGLNCTGNTNGGSLTTDATGIVSCSDDDSGAGLTGSGVVRTIAVWTSTTGFTATSGPLYSDAFVATTSTSNSVFNGIFQASSTALLGQGFTAYASSTLQKFTGTNATTTNATSTNFNVSNNLNVSGVLQGSTLSLTGSSTLQNFTALTGTTTNATSTSFFATLLTAGTSRITSLFADNLTLNGSSTLQNFTGVNATTTNATTTNLAVSNNATVSATLKAANIFATASSTFQNFTGINSTTTGATTTAFAITGAATSTFGGGVNLTTGCFSIANVCVGAGGGSASITSGSSGYAAYYAVDGTTLTYTPTLGYSSSTNETTVFGFKSGGQNATTSNTAVGTAAFGYRALERLVGGTGNGAFGRLALFGVTSGSRNNCFGYSCLINITTQSDNTAFGDNAGANHVGSTGTFFGSSARTLSSSLSNVTAIGYNATADCSNCFILGQAGTNVGIGTTSPGTLLSVAGDSYLGGNVTATGTIVAANLSMTGSTTLQKFTATNATTSQATTTSLAVTSLTSALVVTGATGNTLEYAGASCSNQFIRSLDAVGAATCATVAAADVALANLTATNSTLTFSGTYDGSTARTIGLNLASINVWTGGQSFGNSTTTGTLAIPVGASVITPSLGNLAIDSTNGQLRYNDGNGFATSTHVLLDEFQSSTVLGSSTINFLGRNATATINLVNPRYAATTTSIYCKTSGAGTAGLQVGHGTASTTYMTCNSTGVELTNFPNGSFTARESVYLGVGTLLSGMDNVTITITQAKIAD